MHALRVDKLYRSTDLNHIGKPQNIVSYQASLGYNLEEFPGVITCILYLFHSINKILYTLPFPNHCMDVYISFLLYVDVYEIDVLCSFQYQFFICSQISLRKSLKWFCKFLDWREIGGLEERLGSTFCL